MSWLLPSVIATLAGTVILAFMYFYLYFVDKEKYLGVWAISWTVYSLRFVFMIFYLVIMKHPALLLFNQLFALWSGILLLWGTMIFIQKKMNTTWILTASVISLWIIYTTLFIRSSISFVSLPSYLFLGFVYIWTGISILRFLPINGLGKWLTSITFILWGIHKADYPFLRPILSFAPIGYLMSASFEFMVAIGILIIYFQKARGDLKESEKQFRTFFEYAPIGIAISSGDSLDVTNDSFKKFIGYSDEFLKYKKISDLVIEDEQYLVDQYYKKIFSGEMSSFSSENRYVHKNGNIIWGSLTTTVLKDEIDHKNITISMIQDITNRIKSEKEITDSLEEKTILLKEIHHRVKNNLQIIVSLINMQIMGSDDDRVTDVLRKSYGRIHSMALVHEKLYQSDDLKNINVNDLIHSLSNDFQEMIYHLEKNISINYYVENIYLGVDIAIPCALIINELILNSIKYAFDELKVGEISVTMRALANGSIDLIIKDTGKGLPEDFDLEKSSHLGLNLVKALASQLKGTLTYEINNGTSWHINFLKNE